MQCLFVSQAKTGPVNCFSYAVVEPDTLPVLQLMKEGVRAFRAENKEELENLIALSEQLLATDSTFIFILASDKLISESQQLLANHEHLYNFNQLPWPTAKELKYSNQSAILLSTQQTIQKISSLSDRYNGKADYIVWKCPEELPDYASLYTFWNLNAQPVNFFECNYGQLRQVQELIQKLNQTDRISGCFMSGGKLINGVTINASDNYLSNTQFCFPFKEFINLKAQKNSYELIPQWILAHSSTDYMYSVIEATRIPITTGKILHLKSSGKSQYPGGNKNLFRNHGVKIHKDDTGTFHHFDGNAFYTFATDEFKDSLLNITISTRFRLTKPATYHSIICQGLNFILKVHRGFLCLTIPTQADYYLSGIPIELNTWYTISLVITEGSKLKVYTNGELNDTITIPPISTGTDLFMIGNSPYQERFQGDIRDIQLWNRGLDSTDIAGLYSPQKNINFCWLVLIPVIFLSILSGIVLFRRKRQRAPVPPTAKVEKPGRMQTSKPPGHHNSLFLFGEFSLFNNTGENLMNQMSPKTQQLFLLVTLKTLLGDGITTRELNDVLWPGMHDAAAKNNRGVTIFNLRQVMSVSTGLMLDYADKHWTIKGLENYYIDFQAFRQQKEVFSANTTNLTLLNDLLDILSQPFLQSIQLEWLDSYKNNVNEEHLKWLMTVSTLPAVRQQPDVMLKIATAMFAIDEVNETALHLRINAYRNKGFEALARTSLENFKKRYRLLYNEEYSHVDF